MHNPLNDIAAHVKQTLQIDGLADNILQPRVTSKRPDATPKETFCMPTLDNRNSIAWVIAFNIPISCILSLIIFVEKLTKIKIIPIHKKIATSSKIGMNKSTAFVIVWIASTIKFSYLALISPFTNLS